METAPPLPGSDLLRWIDSDPVPAHRSHARHEAGTSAQDAATREHTSNETLVDEASLPDLDVVRRVREGDTELFRVIVARYQNRLFSTARRHSRREEEVQDIVQEVFAKAFHRLNSFRGDAPFEHWLMRLAIHTCYDFLREHQRNRELHETDLSEDERAWLQTSAEAPESSQERAIAARSLVSKILESLSPANRLVITLLELEERSIKEIAQLTGWSVPLVKVRAFRARAEMRRILRRISREKYL